MLVVKNLHIQTQEKSIIKGITLTVKPGEIHALMGPNGAGKTTLALGLMGNSNYKLTVNNSQLTINNTDLISLTPDKRARAGLFVAFQHPVEITGVSFLSFLRTAHKSLYPKKKIPLSQFKEQVIEALSSVSLSEGFLHRSLNEGFSGGEKKRAEIVQLLVLKPKFAILDEIDSGLDIDSLRIVAKAIQKVVKTHKIGILLITHYQRILHHLKPDRVHVLVDGKIKRSDGMALVTKIEKRGYTDV